MTPALVSHRDDGPLVRALARIAPHGPPAVLSVVAGGLALAGGLVRDGSGTATASLLGVMAFVLLGALSARGRSDGPLHWVVPPLLHAGEYATLLVLAWRSGMPPTAFVLLAVVAAHHYDLLYADTSAGAGATTRLSGGWDGRMLLVAVASVGGALAEVSAVLAGWLAVVLAASAVRRARALLRHDPSAGGRRS